MRGNIWSMMQHHIGVSNVTLNRSEGVSTEYTYWPSVFSADIYRLGVSVLQNQDCVKVLEVIKKKKNLDIAIMILRAKCKRKDKTIKNAPLQLETKHELFKIWLDEAPSCKAPIKSDKPKLCIYPLPFICHIFGFDLLLPCSLSKYITLTLKVCDVGLNI